MSSDTTDTYNYNTQQLKEAPEIHHLFSKVDFDTSISQLPAVKELNKAMEAWNNTRRKLDRDFSRSPSPPCCNRSPHRDRSPLHDSEMHSHSDPSSRSQQGQSQSCSPLRRGQTRDLSPLSEHRYGQREPSHRDQNMPQMPWELIEQYSSESCRAISSALDEVLWLLRNKAYSRLEGKITDLCKELDKA
ncbi:hypothetical protein NP233_g11628 [Leucocoprinus birnbaumii]|uniref:Uncharacterized protein n=1 Tax=Leucocoprinus birnbaumii TaxID=56174 RepID=A0AAD5VIL1_9AGAR|nr:hypothetical protein NP233_g11628 [Leucocoprinus birnbaumii]